MSAGYLRHHAVVPLRRTAATPLFVNRAERAITATVFLLFLALTVNGVFQAKDRGSAVIGGVLAGICAVVLVRTRNRPAVYADDSGVTVKSLLFTRHLPWATVTTWTAEARRVGAFQIRRTVLVAHLSNGKVRDLGREGIWIEKSAAGELIALADSLMQRQGSA